MKGYNKWHYRPYRPLLWETGTPYICRIVPSERAVRLEWADAAEDCKVYYRRHGETDFLLHGTVDGCSYTLTDLQPDTEYEFYVSAGETCSRIRLARTGKVEGTVVNYLHPRDEAYSFSGSFLASPSLVRHPDGYLLASMDVFGRHTPQNLSMIFRSDDNGRSWYYVNDLMPCFWGTLFIHGGALYMLSTTTEYGDLQIGRSDDGGKTFTTPVVLLRGSNGKDGRSGVHKYPINLLEHNGRLYTTLEWGTWQNKEYCHAAMVMSCEADADLLQPENWSFTPPKKFDPSEQPGCDLPACTMTIEGTLAVAPDGRLLSTMRYGGELQAIVYEVDQRDPEAPLRYSHCIDFPANRSKFIFRQDPVTKRYYTVASRIPDPAVPRARNVLTLMVSEDLTHWTQVRDLLDYSHSDWEQIGFQYVDFMIDGEDLLCLCRTAMNGADNFHDSNYITCHRVRNFRDPDKVSGFEAV